MNETRRDDIYQFDDAEIAEHPIVQRMVRDAVAARDAEIREALLSDEVVEAAADAIEAEVYSASHPGGRYSEKGLARAALQAALAAAKGTEGSA